MTDSSEPSKGQDKTEETIFNSDIGDDWGEAFQAEDFLFSPDEEASSEFFLEDDSFNDEDHVSNKDISIHAVDMFAEGESSNLTILDKLLSLPVFILSLPLKIKIATAGLAIAMLIGIFFTFQDSQEIPLTQTPPEVVQGTNPESDQSANQANPEQPLAEQPPSTTQETTPTIVDLTEKVRKRWELPSFLVSSFDDEHKTTELLAINLTFVLLLDKDMALPEDDEVILRESIFQFFNNHPFSDLKRYTLSRGEMNRSLTSWINKQLPDLPLSSIIFERYQLL